MNIELLEARIAPASVSITYHDIDFDLVKITATLPGAAVPPLDDLDAVPGIGSSGQHQLATLVLTEAGFQGASITIVVTKKGLHGDGLVHVGRIDATGIDLGAVVVKGDLGVLDAGSGSDTVPAVKSLSVQSMGLYGTASGAPADLRSDIKGALGSLTVATDVKDAFISVQNGASLFAATGPVKIGGSLIGGLAVNSGQIFSFGGFGDVTIGGNIVGGASEATGAIFATFGEIGKVTLGGSLIGGAGDGSGEIFNLNGGIGAVKIGGNLVGDTGTESGKIDVKTNIASLTVGGSIIGGAGRADNFTDGGAVLHSGQVFAGGTIGPVKVAHDVRGGAGTFTGTIHSGSTMGAVAIGGSLVGGPVGSDAGALLSGNNMGLVKIVHDVIGTTMRSGSIHAATDAIGVTIGGSLVGGAGLESGFVFAQTFTGPISVAHDVLGGSGPYSGRIASGGALGGGVSAVSIGGSLVGGGGDDSGGISGSFLGTVKIGRDLLGGNLAAGAPTLTNSGFIVSYSQIASVTIGGSIFSGIDNSNSGNLVNNASIRAERDIVSLTVKGDIAGNSTGVGLSPVIISAYGQDTPGATRDVAIGKLSARRVEQAKIFAGYNTTLMPMNADAQIGAVTVTGDWIASSLVAGAFNTGPTPGALDDNVNFGNLEDAKIAGGSVDRDSRIASITITGRAMGDIDGREFGFVAEEIGSLKIRGLIFPLDSEMAKGFRLRGLTNVAVHELTGGLGSSVTSNPPQRVDASTLRYFDIDGDVVTVKLSKPLLTDLIVANSVFKFDDGAIDDGNPLPRSLQKIDLSALAAEGVNITVAVQRTDLSDGLADIGYINGGSQSLGTISIAGDLGSIDAAGVKSLKVRTMGRFGLLSSGAYAADLASSLGAHVGPITVTSDVKDASLKADGGFLSGSIDSVTIGGSLLAGSFGGFNHLGAVKIGGSIAGGKSNGAALYGSFSGITSVKIGGSLLGGVAEDSGRISGIGLGAITIGGNVVGGEGKDSGSIMTNLGVASAKIGGSLLGGTGEGSGHLEAQMSGAVSIAHNVRGASGAGSGSIIGTPFGGDIGTSYTGIAIGGSLIGGGAEAGKIDAGGRLGAVKIAHNALGGSGHNSGAVRANTLASYTLGGSLIGGSGDTAGAVVTNQKMGAVKIGHDLAGGTFGLAGVIDAAIDGAGASPLASVTIGGSLVGGSSGSTGGILSTDDVGAVKIGRDLLGGSIGGSSTGFSRSGFVITTGRLAGVTLGGSLVAGLDASNGGVLAANATIRAGEDLSALTIAGSMLGRATDNGATPVIITAKGESDPTATRNLAIGKLSVGGLLSFASIDAGYDINVVAANANAQIGAVSVKGNWLTANLLAGVENTGDNNTPGDSDDNLNFGDTHDRLIGGVADSIAKIASITIGGVVVGTPTSVNGSDHYGFVSHTIGAFKSAGYTAPLLAATVGQSIPLSPLTAAVHIHEV